MKFSSLRSLIVGISQLLNYLLYSQACTKAGGSCNTIVDGFYKESVIFVIIGFIWLYGFGKGTAHKLQRFSPSDWAVRR